MGSADFRAWWNALAVWLHNGFKHTVKVTQAWFADWATEGLHVYFLSPNFPQLNRIEILWRKTKRPRPSTLFEIKETEIVLRKILKSLCRKN